VVVQVSQQATKGHLIVGAILVGLALGSAIGTLVLGLNAVAFLVFFFGVWGGVELGRYLEHSLSVADDKS
jgi:hypothetical protein